MTAKSTYLDNLILTCAIGGGSYTGGNVYLALNTTASTPSAPGTECSDGSYSRQQIVFNTAASGEVINANGMNFFGAGAAGSSTIVEIAIYDASTGGHELYYGTTSGLPVTVSSGDTVSIGGGGVTITETSNKSNTLANALLDAFLVAGTYTGPTGVYAALMTSASTPSSAGTEVSDSNYARHLIAPGAVSGGSVGNSNNLTFFSGGVASGPHTIVQVAVYSAVTGGTELYFGNLTTSKTLSNGETANIPASDLNVTES